MAMPSTEANESIAWAALQMQPEARMRLAHRLRQSFGDLAETELEALWLAEAEYRDAELETDPSQAIPGDEVIAHLETRYRQ